MLGAAAICGGLMASAPAKAQTITIEDRDRMLLSDWVYINNKGCPPGSTRMKKEHFLGLGKPTYRCVVPKNSNVTFYQPGTVLPQTVTYTELPSYIVDALPPPPSGQVYVSADNAVYLIKPETRTVVDSVTVIGTEE
jgi:hypothetical protein